MANPGPAGEISAVEFVEPAVSDGQTDATAAISDAIEAAGEHGAVYVPPGTYLVSLSSLALLDGQTFAGSGRGATTIRALPEENLDDSLTHVLRAKGDENDLLEGVTVCDLTLDFDKDAHTYVTGGDETNSHEVLEMEYCRDALVANVSTVNSNSEGVDWDEMEESLLTGHTSRNCGGWGVHISQGSSRCEVRDSRAIQCGTQQSRGGFDLFGGTPPAERTSYSGLVAIECYQGFQFAGDGAVADTLTAIRCEDTSIRVEGADCNVTGTIVDHQAGAYAAVLSAESTLEVTINGSESAGVICNGERGTLRNPTVRRANGTAITLDADAVSATDVIATDTDADHAVHVQPGNTGISCTVARADNNTNRGVTLDADESAAIVMHAQNNGSFNLIDEGEGNEIRTFIV